MQPGERLQRLLAWCRLPAQPTEWDHTTAERCRSLLPQLAAVAMEVELPAMFAQPLSRYLYNAPSVAEIIDDDDRLLLMLSDLGDYLDLMSRGYR
jgi:hypothetical protein